MPASPLPVLRSSTSIWGVNGVRLGPQVHEQTAMLPLYYKGLTSMIFPATEVTRREVYSIFLTALACKARLARSDSETTVLKRIGRRRGSRPESGFNPDP